MRKIITIIIIALVILISYAIQTNFLNQITLWGAKANIAIVIITIISMVSGPIVGGSIGLAYGIIQDVTISKTIGIYIGIYMAIGIIMGMYSNRISKERKISGIIMVAMCTILSELVAYTIYAIIQNYEYSTISFLIILIKETIYNSIITAIIFKALITLGETINKSKKSYYIL